MELKDAYKSLDEALNHGGIQNNVKVNLIKVDSGKIKISEISVGPSKTVYKVTKKI